MEHLHALQPYFPILECVPHKLAVVVVCEAIGVMGQPILHFVFLLCGQESCRSGVVVDEPECSESHDNGHDSLQYENPGPAWLSGCSIHFIDATGQETSKCTCNRGCGEEHSSSEGTLTAAVPQGNVKADSLIQVV